MNLVKGSALVLLATAGEGLCALVVCVVVGRSGGAPVLGSLTVATSLLLMGVALTELGQNVVLTRRAASGDPATARGLGASLVCKAILGLLCIPLVLALWPRDEPVWGVLAASAYLLIASWAISATAILRGHELFGRAATASLSGGSVAVVGVVLLQPTDLASLLGLLAASQAAKAAFAFALLPPGSARRPVFADVRKLMLETLPFAAAVGIGVAYLKADILLVSVLAGTAEAGRYAAAVRLIEACRLLPAALGGALLPALASGRRGELPRALAVVGVLGALVTVFSLTWAEGILALIFGPSFVGAAGILSVLSCAFVFSSTNGLLLLTLYARRAERGALRAMAMALALNVVTNLFLVTAYGGVGAALAAVVSEAFLCGLYLRELGRLRDSHLGPSWIGPQGLAFRERWP